MKIDIPQEIAEIGSLIDNPPLRVIRTVHELAYDYCDHNPERFILNWMILRTFCWLMGYHGLVDRLDEIEQKVHDEWCSPQ